MFHVIGFGVTSDRRSCGGERKTLDENKKFQNETIFSRHTSRRLNGWLDEPTMLKFHLSRYTLFVFSKNRLDKRIDTKKLSLS
jgi:hypothetical protein